MTLYSIQKIDAKIKEGIGLVKAQGPFRFSKEAAQYIFWELLGHNLVLPLAIMQFKKKAQYIDGVNTAVDFAFAFNYFGLSIRPGQFKNEITQLLNSVKELEPKHLMEIGTAKGGTLFLFCQASSPNAQMISVDLPGGKFGGGYSGRKSKLYRAFAKGNQKIVLIRKNAHEAGTLNEVKNVLCGSKLDFLFIDGDHTYEGVKKDFEMYSPLVRKGGIVAFHDIAKHPTKSKCEVNRFWNEIKCNYRFSEFVNDWNQGTYGIGIIYV
jgi:predicted O-methyltransferase YrrM